MAARPILTQYPDEYQQNPLIDYTDPSFTYLSLNDAENGSADYGPSISYSEVGDAMEYASLPITPQDLYTNPSYLPQQGYGPVQVKKKKSNRAQQVRWS